MSVRATVVSVFTRYCQGRHKTLLPLVDDLPLLELRAQFPVSGDHRRPARKRSGVDPFSAGDGIEMPTTFGEFVKLYDVVAA